MLELDHRHRPSSGLEIWLLWDPASDLTYLKVSDQGAEWMVLVPKNEAWEAFGHPMLYAPSLVPA